MVLPKVLSFSQETATAIILSNTKNNKNLSNKSPCYAAQVFFSVSITLKCRVYLIKIKNVLANFDSEKQFKVKKAYFMAKEIDLIEEK